MNYTRGRFLTFVVLSAAIWLAMLFLGGETWSVDQWLHEMLKVRDARTRTLAERAAWLGAWPVLIGIALVAAIYLGFVRKRRAALLLIMVVVGFLLVELQMMIVDRDQPHAPKYLEAFHSASFPSGYSANAMITYLGIALLLPGREWWHILRNVVAFVIVLAIGWSQVALDQHWASDIIGGYAFGFLWVVICVRLATDRPGD